MHLLVVLSLVGCALAAPQSYSTPSVSHGGGGFSSGGFSSGGFSSGGFSSGGFSSSGEFDDSHEGGFIGGGISGNYGAPCGNGQVRHVDGSCVSPQVTRNVYIYDAPKLSARVGPRPHIPRPRVQYNVIFVRSPQRPFGSRPIVVPPPQQKTLVYVLSKSGQIGQDVIQAPAGPAPTPEVYYVDYSDGENPTLPGGFSLQEALSSAVSQRGRVIGGGGGGFVSGGGISGGFVGGQGGGGGGFIVDDSGEGIIGGQSYSPPTNNYS